jgi:hypothetical protein
MASSLRAGLTGLTSRARTALVTYVAHTVFPLLRPAKGDTVYLIQVPVEGGGRLLVQASDAELPGDLQLAAARPGEVVARARQSLEQALDQIKPAMRAVLDRLVAMSPDEMRVEFGLTLGAETGVVVAKGTSEMHFAVTLSWKRPGSAASGD